MPAGNGYQGIRLFTPEPDGGGEVWEDPDNVHLTTNRCFLFIFSSPSDPRKSKILRIWWKVNMIIDILLLKGGILLLLASRMARRLFLGVRFREISMTTMITPQ